MFSMTSPDRKCREAASPLSDLVVLDLTAVVFGPLCTQIMADLGATVIKVEGPEGDSTRQIGPMPEKGMGGAFFNLNRGKKGICLDLKTPAGRDALLRMIPKVDIFVHSMRPQAIRRLGLDFESIRDMNPRLIYCSAWGFGQDGPYGGKAAYDDIIQAASGLVALTELSTGAANYTPTVIADKVAGLTLLYSCLAAVNYRHRTGLGMEIEVPMFEVMANFMLTEHIGGAMFSPPMGPPVYARQISRSRRPFETSDGRISVIVYTDRQWATFGRLVGVDDLLSRPEFSSLTERTANIDVVYEFLGNHLKAHSTAYWMSTLDRAGIPAMPVNSTADLYEDPHLAAVGMFQDAEDPEFGTLRYPRQPTRFNGRMPEVRHRAPRLGENTEELLTTFGFTREEIEAAMGGGR